jgi:hypothetical protein
MQTELDPAIESVATPGEPDQPMLATEAGDVFYFQNTATAFSTGLASLDRLPAPTDSRRSDTAEDGALSQVIANWGPDNKRPLQIIADIESNPELAQTLYSKANSVIAAGLVYGHMVIDAQGVERLQPVKDAQVEAWLKRTNIKKYLREAAKDFYALWHGFTELLMTADGSQVAAIACQDTSYCRFALQDEKGQIKHVYICANWDEVATADHETVKKRPLLDPYFDVCTQIELGRQPRYVYPTAGTATGRTYYQPAPWHSLRSSGWLELANAIPKFKKALLKNQFTIKYHVQIPDWWWLQKYPDWEQKPALKRGRIADELAAFNKKMAGEEGQGNSVLTMVKTSPDGRAYDGWKITAIDDKLQDGKYIEDSQEACSHIFFAVGIDPTLIGATPGKGQGAGSGSDKRVAYNIQQLNSKPEADILLEPVQLAFDYNKFGTASSPSGQAYTVMFRGYYIETLNQGRATKELQPGGPGE